MREPWGVAYRDRLPQLAGDRPYLTDGGLETSLIFHQGLDLPAFAAFPLASDEAGRDALKRYFEPFLAIPRERGAGFVLDTATWRANPDWGAELGYTREGLADANRHCVAFAEQIRDGADGMPVVISGAVGPRGDGYVAGEMMSADEAERYHSEQITTFADTAVDMISAITLTYADEATGIVRAAVGAGIPVVVSFTVETDGRLPSGQALGDAIEQVDAETDGAAAYFMINCAHPTHFSGVVEEGGRWLSRIGGIRANASAMSHAELDEAEELDDGDPAELAGQYAELRPLLPEIRVLGGCCGTDHRHVAEINRAWEVT
jgi:S-methylmethionine-dependent homocysteine/selenocysteine methylase